MAFLVKGDWIDWENTTLEELKTHIILGSITLEELFKLHHSDRFKEDVAKWVRVYLQDNVYRKKHNLNLNNIRTISGYSSFGQGFTGAGPP